MLRRWSDSSEVTKIPFEEEYNQHRWEIPLEDFNRASDAIKDYARARDGFCALDLVEALWTPFLTDIAAAIGEDDLEALKLFLALAVWHVMLDEADTWLVDDSTGDPVYAMYARPAAYARLKATAPKAFSASKLMKAQILAYRESRNEFAAKMGALVGKDIRTTYQDILAVAETLIRGVGDLSSARTVPAVHAFLVGLRSDLQGDEINRGFAKGKLTVILDEVMVRVAEEAAEMIDGAFERLAQLLLLVRAMEASPHAASFLQRVSRCYVFGFDAECVTMCRAAIDAEF
jgi:hypothetical protein